MLGCGDTPVNVVQLVKFLAWQVVRASCWISLETEFGGERPIANISDRNGSEFDIITCIICKTQRGVLTTNEDSNQ